VNVSDPVFFDDVLARGLYFYGNIGIGRVSLFTSPQYNQFAQAIDEDGGILRHRWDDQHVYALAIALFSNYNRTIGFTFDMLPFYHRGEALEHRPCQKNQRSLGGSRGVVFSS
jgi:Glycolipid 2-alpha-mannosyltransferase